MDLARGLEVYYGAPGPAVPEGYSALDLVANPNYEKGGRRLAPLAL